MATASELEVTIRGDDLLTPDLQKIESKVIRFVGSISAALAAIKIGTAPIAAAAEFEHELAQVAKTTDFVSLAFKGQIGTLDQLSAALLNMSLGVGIAASELAKIAAAAGQQGLGKFGVQGIVDFTAAVARMSSTLQISAEEAATNLGKIATVFKLPLAGLEQAISTITAVSVASTASGKELLDVIRRIGDARGALTLPQAAGFAATGIDFGFSPEVVGTAISKMFNSAFANADKFAGILEIPVKDWIKQLETDGPRAFISFLDKLRTLDKQSQLKASNELLGGGGRQGAIVGKLLQDTTNSVLRGNLEAAQQGQGGTVAIEQQAKELDTLTEQIKILRNSLTKLGIDSTAALLTPLKLYTAQLSDALQQPGVKSFVNALVKGFGETINSVVKLAKFLGDLNVNWENFIRVAKVFSELRLAQLVFGLLSGFLGLSTALKSIAPAASATASASQRAAGAAEELSIAELAAAQQSKAGFASRLLGLDLIKAKYEELTAAALRQKEVDAFIDRSAAARFAEKAAPVANALATPASVAAPAALALAKPAVSTADIAAAAVAVDRQKQAVIRAEEQVIASRLSLGSEEAAKITQLQVETTARELEIEQAYQTKRLAIKATGTETGLKAARREKAQLLEEESARYATSLAETKAFYANQIAVQEAALTERLRLEQTNLVKVQAAQSRLVDRQARETAQANPVAPLVGPPRPVAATEVADAEKAAITARQKLLDLQSVAEVKSAEKNVAVRIAVNKTLQEFDERSAVTRLTAEQNFNTVRKTLQTQGLEQEIAVHETAYKAIITREDEMRASLLTRAEAYHTARTAREDKALQEDIARQEIATNAAIDNFTRLETLRASQQAANTNRTAAIAAQAAAPKTVAEAASNVADVRKIRITLEGQSKNLVQTEEALLQAKLAEIDAAGSAKRQAILAEYQAKRKAIEAGGTETGLQVNAAAQAKALQQEIAAREQRIAAIRAEYAQRLVDQRVFLAEQIAVQRSVEAAALLQQRALARAPTPVAAEAAGAGAALGAAGAAGLVAATAGAGAGIETATAKLGLFDKAVNVLRVAFPALSTVIVSVGSAILRFASIFAKGFLWVTIIYSVLDAFHLLDGVTDFLGKTFTKLGDAIGLDTSKKRENAIATEELRKKTDEFKASLEEQTKAFDDNRIAATGKQNLSKPQELVAKVAGNADPEKQTANVNDLGALLNAAFLKAGDAQTAFNAATQKRVDEQVEIIRKGNQKIAELQEQNAQALRTQATLPPEQRTDLGKVTEEYTRQIAAQRTTIETAREQLKQYDLAVRSVASDSEQSALLLAKSGEALGKIFTPSTLAVAENFVPPIKNAEVAVTKAKDAFLSASQALSRVDKTNPVEQLKAAKTVADADVALKAANQTLTDAKKNLKDFLDALGTMEVPESFKESLKGILSLFDRAQPDAAKAILTAARQQASRNPASLTGETKVDTAPPATGDGTADTAAAEALARRIRTQQRALLAAEVQARKALNDAAATEELAVQQRFYDQGLIDIKKFYADRERIQQDALKRDIADKKAERAELGAQLKDVNPTDPAAEAERLRIRTEMVKVDGQINVLRQRATSITNENVEAERRATQALDDQMASQKNLLADAFIIPSTVGERFAADLKELEAQHREFINRIKSKNPELAAALEIKFKVDAFTRTIAPINTEVDAVINRVQRSQDRLALDVERGVVDVADAASSSLGIVKQTLPSLQALLATQTEALKQAGDISTTSPAAYKQLEDQVDQTRLKIEKFSAQTVTLTKEVTQATNTFIDLSFKELANTQTRLNVEAANGQITSAEAARLYSDAIKSQLPAMEAQLALQEKALELEKANKGAGAEHYRALAADVDATRVKLAELESQTDSIAKSVNNNLTSTLADALDKVTEYGSSLTDVVKGFLLSVAQNIKKIIFQNIAEKLIGPDNPFGKGFQEALTGKKSQEVASKTSVDKVGGTPLDSKSGAASGPLGSSGDPLYVNVVNTPKVEQGNATKTVSDASVSPAPIPASPAAQTFPITDGPTGAPLSPLHVVVDQSPTTPASVGKSSLTPEGNNLTDSGGARLSPVAPTSTTTTGDSFNLTSSDSQGLKVDQGIMDAGGGAAFDKSLADASKSLDTFGATTQDTGLNTSGALGAMASVADKVSPGLGGMISTVQSVVQLFQFLASAIAAATAAEQAKATTSLVAGVAHTGGIVGSGTFGGSMLQSRVVHPALFANAPRYHGGGTAGIRPGEVPAILQKGEAVLTKNQQSLVAAAMHPTHGPQKDMNIRNILVADPSFVHDAMSSAQGEKVILSFITKNRGTVRQALG